MPVLRATFLEQHIQGTGPKTGYSPMKRNQEQQKMERGWLVGQPPQVLLVVFVLLVIRGLVG